MADSSYLTVVYPDENTLEIRLTGNWNIGADLPAAETVLQVLRKQQDLRQIHFDAQALSNWDSSLLTFLLSIIKEGAKYDIPVEISGLPTGVQRLIKLATAVPKKEQAQLFVSRDNFLARVGDDFIDFVRSTGELLAFVGEASIAFGKLIAGTARFRPVDLGLFLQESGARAVPIVSLISFLIGLILAFIGILQLKLFGAQIYVADLVGIAMVREMGAIMTGIIMAGRTGAAFAAQLGTMQVNEEIDALTTLGISAMEFLVLPRLLALTLMMPLLCLYADVMGIFGGWLVAVPFYNISSTQYFNRTIEAVGLNDLFIGLFMSMVFGILVALAGCLRGIQCGRSASAVGEAATSAVVTGIVAIICATAVITVLCDVLGI